MNRAAVVWALASGVCLGLASVFMEKSLTANQEKRSNGLNEQVPETKHVQDEESSIGRGGESPG